MTERKQPAKDESGGETSKQANGANADLHQWLSAELETLHHRLAGLNGALEELAGLVLSEQTVKEAYTTQEVAHILGKRPYTVREWCRHGRVHAYKAAFGRGGEDEWRIGHQELVRIQNEGLLPLQRYCR